MKYENLFKIHIPEPCHEDWDKMTPNEQGSFCKVCAKTVVDFSDKSEAEIQNFLTENIDKKVCGRFRISQLDDRAEEIPKLKIEQPKFEFPGFLMPVITPFRAYAMAMMLFASAALAGCGNSEGTYGGDNKRLAGAVQIVDSTDMYNDDRIQGGLKADYNNYNENTDSTCNIEDDYTTVGKIKIDYTTDTLKIDTTEIRLLGEIEPVKKTHGMINKRQPESQEYLKGDVKMENKEE
jgi:hypothetical protein